MPLHRGRPPFHVTDAADTTTVCFDPSTVLTEAHAEALARRLSASAGGPGRPPVTLDLAGVTGLDSAALGKLVALHRAVGAAGGRLALANLTPAVGRVFRTTRLDALFAIRAADSAPV